MDKHIDAVCAENILFGILVIFWIRLNMIALLHHIPLMLSMHVYAYTPPLQIELTKELMWDKISYVSGSVAGNFFQKGIDVSKLSTDYLGVNTYDFTAHETSTFNLHKELQFPDDVQIILTDSRIITGTKIMLKEKRIVNLIQAFSKIHTRYPKARFVIAVGRAAASLKNKFVASYEMLMGYINIHDIEKTMVNIYELDQMPPVYRQSHLFVLAAEVNEIFGQTFIERMSYGTHVIGAKTGGTRDYF